MCLRLRSRQADKSADCRFWRRVICFCVAAEHIAASLCSRIGVILHVNSVLSWTNFFHCSFGPDSFRVRGLMRNCGWARDLSFSAVCASCNWMSTVCQPLWSLYQCLNSFLFCSSTPLRFGEKWGWGAPVFGPFVLWIQCVIGPYQFPAFWLPFGVKIPPKKMLGYIFFWAVCFLNE